MLRAQSGIRAGKSMYGSSFLTPYELKFGNIGIWGRNKTHRTLRILFLEKAWKDTKYT